MGRHTKKRLPENKSEVLTEFKAKTIAQEKLVKLIKTKEVIIVSGSSGVGKTYVALATALNLLDMGYKRITLVKSVTTIPGEQIGFIPGTYQEKMEPFLMSYT
jgi:phosphate starvation-inducible PhoH-like protein